MTAVRHCTELAALGREPMAQIIARARELRAEPTDRRVRRLSGREIVHLFLEPSTRTRVSFEIAARRMGATVIDFDADASSLQKGESLADTVRTIESMGTDALVIRHSEVRTAERIAEFARSSVINAGDGVHAHPTQGLLDLLTLLDEFGELDGRRIAIVGDIRHSRVARSDVAAFSAFGADVVLVAPPQLRPESCPEGARYADGLEDVLPETDAVVCLRIQRERIAEGIDLDVERFVREYQMTEESIARAPDHCVVLHPGPMNRGVEITDAVADGPRSRILAQVENGVAARMAVLEWCLGGAR